MKDRLAFPLVDRAPGTLAPSLKLPPKSFAQKLAERTSETPPAATSAQLQQMTARIDALEETLRTLIGCTVQQGFDGKVYLPVGDRLAIQTGNVLLVMTRSEFLVQFGGRTVLSLPAATSTAGSSSGSGPTSWQSIAATNAIDNPRTLAPGQMTSMQSGGSTTNRRTP